MSGYLNAKFGVKNLCVSFDKECLFDCIESLSSASVEFDKKSFSIKLSELYKFKQFVLINRTGSDNIGNRYFMIYGSPPYILNESGIEKVYTNCEIKLNHLMSKTKNQTIFFDCVKIRLLNRIKQVSA